MSHLKVITIKQMCSTSRLWSVAIQTGGCCLHCRLRSQNGEKANCLFAVSIGLDKPNTDPAVVVNTGTVFVKLKDHGGLVHPSHSVIVVCQETKKCFSRMKAVLGDSLPQASHKLLSCPQLSPMPFWLKLVGKHLQILIAIRLTPQLIVTTFLYWLKS